MGECVLMTGFIYVKGNANTENFTGFIRKKAIQAK